MTEHVKINRRQFLQAGAVAVGGGMLLLNSSVVEAEAWAAGPGRSGSSHISDEQEGPMELTLKRSLDLAGQHLLGMLNPEDNYLPYWALMVQQDYKAQMNVVWPAHNIGRWWDAMLRLEDAVGFRIPKKAEAAMLANTHRFFDNPDHICISPDPKAIWELHSLREGLLALNALARWRKNDWAASQGQKMILSIAERLRDDGTWDLAKFDATQKDRQLFYPPDACESHGRMLEALVWFYETTGDLEALRLGDRIARWHFENTTQPDGGINKSAKADHMHSYLGTLRGLLLWGQMTRQHEYLARVADTYRTTVRSLVHESGYTSHNLKESFPETTSPGDAAQIALWLSREGYGEFLDDAERLVRARLLPSQIVTSPPLRPTVDDGKDRHRDLDKRVIGGYGGCHTKPHGGKQGVTDVTAAGVHTLIDIYKHVAVTEGGQLTVLFHMAY
ncbi:MAG: hypothetical protein WCL39_10770, partial [Armatimonadota bacterium]